MHAHISELALVMILQIMYIVGKSETWGGTEYDKDAARGRVDQKLGTSIADSIDEDA